MSTMSRSFLQLRWISNHGSAATAMLFLAQTSRERLVASRVLLDCVCFTEAVVF